MLIFAHVVEHGVVVRHSAEQQHPQVCPQDIDDID